MVTEHHFYFFLTPVIFKRCQMANVKPPANPSSVNRTLVPNRLSNHRPKTPGKTISMEMVITRATHAIALATADRSSEGFVTSYALRNAP
jgi:hypothetical protein